MLILLYGSDSYRRIRRLKNLIEGYRNKYPRAALGKFDFESLASETGQNDFLKFHEFIKSRSIFDDKKIAVLENVYGRAGVIGSTRRRERRETVNSLAKNQQDSVVVASPQIKELKRIFKSILSSQDLILIISESSKPPASWIFLLKLPVRDEEFEELTGAKLKNFVKSEIKSMGVNLREEALDFLVDHYKTNLWGLMTELEKLRFSTGTSMSGSIDLEAVKMVGDYSESQNIFHFMNAVQYSDAKSKRLRALEGVFFSREEPAKIFNILASRNHPPEFLAKLADYDIMVKSGRMDYEEVLLDLALG